MMTEIPPAETQLEGTGGSSPTMDARTRLLLEAPIGRTLLLLAAPNIVVMVAQAAVAMGGSDASLEAAVTYSNWVFSGAILV